MIPTDSYFKAKRTLVFFVGALLLSVFVGIDIVDGEKHISVLPFQIKKPEYLPLVLFLVVLFYLFQHSLHWAAQHADVRNNRFYRIEFVSTVLISSGAMLCYLGYAANILPLTGVSSTVVSAAIGGLIAAVFTALVTRISTYIRNLVVRRDRTDEGRIASALKRQKWRLMYNPAGNHSKEISFLDTGDIGAGKNNNESKWRIKNALLEILNKDDKVFSRFKFDRDSETFEHTNDPDTLSIRSQRISPLK